MLNDRSERSFIKFETQAEYDRFVEKLVDQVKAYTQESCLAHGIRVGSSDAKAIEEVIFDVSVMARSATLPYHSHTTQHM